MQKVNVYIKGTAEGSSTDEEGHFSFACNAEGEVTLCASMLGYDEFSQTAPLARLRNILIRLRPSSVSLDDVVVVGSNYLLKGNSRWNKMSAVDLVTETSSNGDLYKAIGMLPGTQASDDNGELQVRGGNGRETQTYIDDMHVLFPYTTTDKNRAARGRYSPFMFEGINFAAGGYSQEYAEGLSAVLPLYTKDKSEITKCGISPSVVGLSGGGTKAFDKGSLSLNMDYWDMGIYNTLFPDRIDWIRPYRRFSGAAQFRYSPTGKSTFKAYVNYDRTGFRQQVANLRLGLREDHVYANATFKTTTAGGWNFFAGAAFSFRHQNYREVRQPEDTYREKEQEIHLKTKTSKRIGSSLRLSFGVESFIRSFRNEYRLPAATDDAAVKAANGFHPLLSAGFASLVWSPRNDLFVEVSSRGEYNRMNRRWNVTPRLAVNYQWKGIQYSVIAGRYTQLPENEWLQQNHCLPSEACTHFIGGANYAKDGRVFRVEIYYKKYDRLAWKAGNAITSRGYGRAKGIDLFFKDSKPPVRNLDYTLTYSYGYSKRKYGEYDALTTPPYATLHNASVALRYQLLPLKTIVSLSNRFADGRPYHNPDKPGIMNDRVKPYNSLDLSITYLASPKVLVYASASNLLCRKNVYGKENGKFIRNSSDHSFFIGVFITLSGKTAYDVSNF
ncbi:MAG: TonB-dependent receptor [Eubacterium sp.]|nr:TonB-dependent receptor [Eubacterium sp.]